jgi:chaperone BCS1
VRSTSSQSADEPLNQVSIRNDKTKLDPALIRPGRVDDTIEFRNADKTICREIFKAFYPVTGKFPVVCDPLDVHALDEPEPNQGQPTLQPHLFVNHLAEEFAAIVPEGELSSAEIQGK